LWAPQSERLRARIWEAIGHLGGSRPTYERDGEPLGALAVSRSGEAIAAAGKRGGLRIWSLSDGQELFSCALDAGSTFLAWTADDRWLATSSGSQLRLVDPDTGEIVAIGIDPNGSRIANGVASPDGLMIATAHDDRTIHLWLPVDGASLHETRGFRNIWETSRHLQ
jgi:WD40 repeat protein